MRASVNSGVSFDEYLEEDDFCGVVAQHGDTVASPFSRAVVEAIKRINVDTSSELLAKWAGSDESVQNSGPAELGEFVEEFQDLAGESYANQIYAWIQP